MWADWQGGTFALPPGADFCRGVVEGLLARMAGKPPEALASVTIYANSGRTIQTLREVFDDHAAHHGPILLPRMMRFGDLGSALPGERAAPLARVLELGNLVARLMARDPGIGAGQSAPELAESLAALMSEMQTEGCGPGSLDRVDAGNHAAHWQRALAFLKIAAQFYLTDPPVDQSARQRAKAEGMARLWQDGQAVPDAPILAVGSTGSHGATRLFLQAVARLKLGAVILPGYDFHQPERVWDDLADGAEDHPQARLAVLRHGSVRPWVAVPDSDRNRFISLALRPAPVTDQWIAEGPDLPDLREATAAMTLIEADQPQEEADAIAVIIRDAVAKGRKTRLFAADRGLVRRVAAALDRWGLVIDDSAGEPLHLTQPGLFLRHVAGLFGRPLTIDALLTLLKHPVTATGGAPGDNLRMTRDMELHLRRHGPAFPDAAFLRDWGSRAGEDRKGWTGWLADTLDLLSDSQQETGPRPVQDHMALHLKLARMLAAGPGGDADASALWNDAAGRAAEMAMTLLATHAPRAQPMGARDYARLIDTHLAGQGVRAADRGHPLIRACGTRDARTEANLGDGALIVLAGLNEGGWPQPLSPDPWLSRAMRAEIGLTLPERLIGLSAHDFQQAVAAPEVVLTRARRDAEAETIPSRWLNRMTNLMSGLPERSGPEALGAMRARGAVWLDLARQLARPRHRLDPAPRPAPIPPAPAFDAISVTQVKTLIRDPYAIYASKVLGLEPLDPLRPEPGAQLRGQVLHKVAERLLQPRPGLEITAEDLRARFLEITAEVLSEHVPWPAARAFWQARMTRIADRIAADEQRRLQRGAPVVVEAAHSLPVPGLELKLTAKPDRIDLLDDSAVAHVYDYKSGRPPSDGEMAHFDKQLVLEAAMVMRGAFPEIGAAGVEGVSYIQLGGEGETFARSFSPDMAEETWAKFVILATRYLRRDTGFTARRALQKVTDASDYDHLSRYGEWGAGDVPVKMRVGGDD
ncbi:ATP-dependent helicase/nuclease subunit B [Paracoccus isoporae]|uniref:ATP-dependent helicase/nuclease subunit B n=1 Tax=Paracoccus isoporae TaxID=591205 RepID=A0A1G6UWU4_9RHOB|nr:double-strand break repair protein AddB [Paracoccus isoporae]SDD45731.1 ATP-dependent helicase/nuclease subunit B [Paracoccus isoporae]